MELFRPSRVVRELKNNRVSERESMHYLVSLLLWHLLAAQFDKNSSAKISSSEFFTLLAATTLSASLLLASLSSCYRANGGARGQDFVKRYICISLPVDVVTALVMAFLILLLGFGLTYFGTAGRNLSETPATLLVFSIQIVFGLWSIAWKLTSFRKLNT